MNPRRFATVAAVLCETAFVACVAGFGSKGTENSGAMPIADRSPSSLSADAARATAIDSAEVTARPVTQTVVAPDESESIVQNAETVAKAVTATEGVAPDQAEAMVKAALTVSLQMQPGQTPPPAQLAMASTPVPGSGGARAADSSIEIVEECLVVDICIDRFLWELYQRTPKEDTVKVDEHRRVKVRKKGKTVTVSKTFTTLVNEDFTWKDAKAAEKARMPMADYVIGGMDRGFKLKLFHALHAAEQAGLSPGITSAFRDDYRQSIASGLKAASDRSWHGGSSRGGYGHGLAADIVSVKGPTRAQRQMSSEGLWKWIDAHEKEFGIGRPYLDKDPPHVAPIDGQEYGAHRGTPAASAGSDVKKRSPQAARDDHSGTKRAARSSKIRTI
jgi:D-alanyl-D-alanine carboxypeptidase